MSNLVKDTQDKLEVQVCKTALEIVNPGACNPVAVANEAKVIISDLRNMGMLTDRVTGHSHPAVWLIMTQLCSLVGYPEAGDSKRYSDALKFCGEKAGVH